MKFKYIFSSALIFAAMTTGCIDKFSDINTDPSVVDKADVRFLFTKALADFEPSKYQQWYYNNNRYTMPWSQALVAQSGNLPEMNEVTEWEGQTGQLYNVMSSTEEINYLVTKVYDAETAAKYQHINALCTPLKVYMGLFATDMYGATPYTEAFKARYTFPPLLKPKYDTMEELYTTWLSELDKALNTLQTVDSKSQIQLNNQDFIYKGSIDKWSKMINSLKLKIAVRLLHADKPQALKIAEEVMANKAGVMTTHEDDFIYNKGSEDYHFWDDITFGAGSKNLISFLVANKDPRVRFFFQKNDFNSKVVQAFFDVNKKLPSYIDEKVEFEVVEGKKVFKGWKAPGEPWVRYHGAPVSVEARFDPSIRDEYFTADSFKITMDGVTKQYMPLAIYNEEMIQGGETYVFPDAPNVPATEDNVKNPWFGLFMSSAEVNLYLAELKLLGANIPGTAQEYFTKGIQESVTVMDKMAASNKIPYYANNKNELYDSEFEATIKLQAGEIENLLENEAYQLTGSVAEQLEKVYIQQYVHLLSSPTDMFETVRRSGVPMKNSKYLAWDEFRGENYTLPRRYPVKRPDLSDIMFDITVAAYEAQGFTIGDQEAATLSNERVWSDVGAPNFGEGPNF